MPRLRASMRSTCVLACLMIWSRMSSSSSMSCSSVGVYSSLQLLQILRASRCATTPSSVAVTRNGSSPRSSRRAIADQDRVGVLAQHRAEDLAERQLDVRLDLALDDAVDVVLDGVLGGDQLRRD